LHSVTNFHFPFPSFYPQRTAQGGQEETNDANDDIFSRLQ